MVFAAVQQDLALHAASKALQADREVELAAVIQAWSALGVISVVSRGDRGVVLAAVQKDGFALGFASEALRGDPEIRAAAGSALFSLARLSVPGQFLLGWVVLATGQGSARVPEILGCARAGDVRHAYICVLVTLLGTTRDVKKSSDPCQGKLAWDFS